MPFRRYFAGVLLLLLTAAALMAQQQPITPTEQPVNGQPYTLRVYPTLFQVPTLIVYNGFPEDEDKRPPTPKDFSITLDDGPAFKPEDIRLEGADPIQLIILADLSGEQNHLLKDFGSALALAATSLRPQDRISLYAMDCNLVTSMQDQPPDAAVLQEHFAALLASPIVHGKKTKSACRDSLHLWDDIAFLTRQFQATPSRRVLLIVSEGRDTKSTITAEKTREFVTFAGASVFGMRDSLAHGAVRDMAAALAFHGIQRGQDELSTLVASEGGNLYGTTGPQLAKALPKFIDDLRGRYILEFMGPSGGGSGTHAIDIQIDRDSTVARPAPITAALPDPAALAADPTVIPSGSKTVTFGTHRPKQ